jgi:3-vinyl bacteriochlorophyllide hydratase
MRRDRRARTKTEPRMLAHSSRSRELQKADGRAQSGVHILDRWIGAIAACPWPAHTGAATPHAKRPAQPLYTPQERARRDASVWTVVQAVLAPLQFLVFLVSLTLVLRYLQTGIGHEIAAASVIAKTLVLYLIMVTGSVWEKVVFGKWLFARAFFWEDVFSMLVLALHTLYVLALAFGWWSSHTQMLNAIAAYATYVINAGQFLLKLRAARLESVQRHAIAPVGGPFGGHAA